MSRAIARQEILQKGTLSFSVESRILRELGERLVKKPEVAILELVKNTYDADATLCHIEFDYPNLIIVEDDGSGMTLAEFTNGWMRIGTSSREEKFLSDKFSRLITGEKGIGRFAVRFLGRALLLESIAFDSKRRIKTRLVAKFDWPAFDRYEDLGKIRVPYRLEKAGRNETIGTKLTITQLRTEARKLDLKKLKTGSLGVLNPIRSMFLEISDTDKLNQREIKKNLDPGFVLRMSDAEDEGERSDVAAEILNGFMLRATVILKNGKLNINIYRRRHKNPYLKLVDTFASDLNWVSADIRFFPKRKGSFVDLPVDGRRALSWIVENSGVAVFDRGFRVQPYGMATDDWLKLAADAARNRREPRSSIAEKHFPMSKQARSSTKDNWMLRLPQPAQLVGLVRVKGRRSKDATEKGLIASADREGFVENEAFEALYELIRGAVEAIAHVDRSIQQEEEREQIEEMAQKVRAETRSAIKEINANPNISESEKNRFVAVLLQTQQLAEQHEESAREREQQLEVMSLLGIVAGFMTHEFGEALRELKEAHADLELLAKTNSKFKSKAKQFAEHIDALGEFVTYSSGYIQGTKSMPSKRYAVLPRLRQVQRIFGKYADDRNIEVEIGVNAKLMAPFVPASLYSGIALNLYTNALKAVTAKAGREKGRIAFRAWNEKQWHYLEVSDNGIGIPSVLKERVFDPLFTTTDQRQDPLGSGMGLGLALVKRGAKAFGGDAELVLPPPDFATCVRVKLPVEAKGR